MEKKKAFIPVSFETLPDKADSYIVLIKPEWKVPMYFNGERWEKEHYKTPTHWLKEEELYVFTADELENLLRYAFNEGDNVEPGMAGYLQVAEDKFINSLNLK